MSLQPSKWPLPEKGSLVPPAAIQLEHADFTARKKYWEFFRHSDDLTGGYLASVQDYQGPSSVPLYKTTYLIPHIKEASATRFARRVAAAKPPRFVREGIESIVGVLTQQEPNRDNYPPKLATWTSGVDTAGSTLQQWLAASMWPLVERYGLCYSYARRPSVAAPNLALQEQALRDAGLPEVLLHIITPENLPWWSVDDIGRFEIIRYTEERVQPLMVDGYATDEDVYTRHWWLTLEGWWYCDENKRNSDLPLQVIDVGTWNTDGSPLRHFPVVKWGLKNGIGPTEVAAFAQLMYFRKDSELHNIEQESAFAMTWIPTTSGNENPEESVKGEHIVGEWDPEGTGGAKPMILETTGVSLSHFVDKRLPELEAAAMAPYGINDSVAGANDSGVALAHIQEKAKNIFRQHSKAGGQSEFAGLQPVAELLGEELLDENRAAWTKNFGTLSDSSQSDILTAFWDMEPGEEFQKEILKSMASMIGDMTAEQLETAIAAWITAREEQDQREQEQEDALFESEGELRRAQTDKTDADAKSVKKPFAANPKNAGTQKEKDK